MIQDYDKVVMEHFDMTDPETITTMANIQEADRGAILDSLAGKLYESIMDKVSDIDYESIPNSKGDITQIQNYDKLIECIETIDQILTEFNQDKSRLIVVQTAIANVAARKDVFMKAFAVGCHPVTVIYNTVVLAIVASISLLISSSIAFVSDAGDGEFSVKFDAVAYNKSKDNLLYKDLAQFNTIAANGDLDKGIDYMIGVVKKNLLGVDTPLIVGAMAMVGITLSIIPLLRELIFFFYNSKQSVSDYFEVQSEMIRINAEYVRNNTVANRTDKERKEIAKKQDKIADTFNKIAIATRVDCQKASQRAASEVQASDRKYKVKELVKTSDLEINQDNSSIF